MIEWEGVLYGRFKSGDNGQMINRKGRLRRAVALVVVE